MTKLASSQLTAWRLLLTLHRRAVDAIDHDLQTAGHLPLASYDVLIELQAAPERRLRMAELAERVLLSRSGLTRLADRLEQEGLLMRDRVAGDRRGAYAVLTDVGHAALQAAWPTYAHGILTYFAEALTPEETALLTTLLQKIAEHLAAQH